MEYAYATLLLNETGEELNESNLIAVLEAAGGQVMESRVKALVAALEDFELDDVAPRDLEAQPNGPSVEQAVTASDTPVDPRSSTSEREEAEGGPTEESISDRSPQ